MSKLCTRLATRQSTRTLSSTFKYFAPVLTSFPPRDTQLFERHYRASCAKVGFGKNSVAIKLLQLNIRECHSKSHSGNVKEDVSSTNEATTHFGFTTVKESEKVDKGNFMSYVGWSD